MELPKVWMGYKPSWLNNPKTRGSIEAPCAFYVEGDDEEEKKQVYYPKAMQGKPCKILGYKKAIDKYGKKQWQCIFRILDKEPEPCKEIEWRESVIYDFLSIDGGKYRHCRRADYYAYLRGKPLCILVEEDFCGDWHSIPSEVLNSKPEDFIGNDGNDYFRVEFSLKAEGTEDSPIFKWESDKRYLPSCESCSHDSEHELGVAQGAYAEDAGIYGWDLD